MAEVVDDRPMLLLRHPADARSRALADIAEQARPAQLLVVLEYAGAAGAHGKNPEQQVDRLADGPGVGVRTEVPGALTLGASPDHDARELLGDGDSEPGIGLVVAVLDVEPGVVFLDPGVLQLQRLDLVVDDCPVNLGGRAHHRSGAAQQRGRVGEVGIQSGAKALRLSDIDDTALRVGEAVHARLVRYGPWRRPVRRHRVRRDWRYHEPQTRTLLRHSDCVLTWIIN